MDSDALSRLQASLGQVGPQGTDLSEQLLDALRGALASAIGDVFLISAAVVVAAFVVTLFLKEMPLQRRRTSSQPVRATESP